MKKGQKDRIRLLQAACTGCGRHLDVWVADCPVCKTTTGRTLAADVQAEIREKVDALEQALQVLEGGKPDPKAPFAPTDAVTQAARALAPWRESAGLGPYLKAARAAALPHLTRVQERTLRANVVLLVVLLLFPVVPLVMGWDWAPIVLMLLPAAFSGLITVKAWTDLTKIRAEAAAV